MRNLNKRSTRPSRPTVSGDAPECPAIIATSITIGEENDIIDHAREQLRATAQNADLHVNIVRGDHFVANSDGLQYVTAMLSHERLCMRLTGGRY
jgi:hypothetical protein